MPPSGLYKRNDSPYWWANYVDHRGRRIVRSTRVRDRKAAEAWLAAREFEKVKAGAGLPYADEIALARAVAVYLAEMQSEWSEKWWKVSASLLQELVNRFGPTKLVRDIMRVDALEWRADLAKRPKRLSGTGRKERPSTRTIEKATINRFISIASAFGNWCKQRSFHTSNVFAELNYTKERKKLRRVATREQIDIFISDLKPRWRVPIIFAADTGWRNSDLCRLQWQHIDWEHCEATVIEKNGEQKTAWLSPRVMHELTLWPRRPDGLVFGNFGDPRKALKKAAKRIGHEHVTMHTLRHWWASWFGRRAGAADMMGSGNWKTLEAAQRYLHSGPVRMREIMTELGIKSGTPEVRSELAPEKT